MRRGLRSCHGLGRKPSQLDRESALGGGTEGAPGVVVELDMNCRVRWKARFSRKECSLAFGKKFSTLLKTLFKAASKLGKNFTEHETAIHTCSQCLHKHFLQLQLKSTPALHRISHRFFPASPKLLFHESGHSMRHASLDSVDSALVMSTSVDAPSFAGRHVSPTRTLGALQEGRAWSGPY